MVLRCAWGTCNSDERYPERLGDAKFILFPKPKTQLAKCLRWIKACGRPHAQLNVHRINKHKAVCSKHFVGGQGPTAQYPDPVQADGTPTKENRRRPRKRPFCELDNEVSQSQNINPDEKEQNITTTPSSTTLGTQTDETWIAPLDFLSLAAEVKQKTIEVQQKDRTIKWLREQLRKKEAQIVQLKKENSSVPYFSVEEVIKKEAKHKGLFKYYTGITYISFMTLISFLVSQEFKFQFSRRELRQISNKNGLFFTLCRLRHNFGLQDLGIRFSLSMQSASELFNTWINHMYYKLGQISMWPHRDTIIKSMPKQFRNEFPTTLVIIDGTELKTQIPAALTLQSQMYSDYKSSSTLKALIGCDPSGSVIFVSELFTGSISDKEITKQSGFYDVIQQLKDIGYVKEGDSVMADKGFTIHDELSQLGLSLNIPPFAAAGAPLSESDIEITQKIARHRVHIERVIRKVKTYKILSNYIPTSLFTKINQIWTICCYLTLFQDVFVSDK